MITLVACPKPFTDPHIATIQRNAIRSWARLSPSVEVLLVGNEEGIADVADHLAMRHIPEVRRNEHGTPFLASVLEIGEKHGGGEDICYVNSDIILLSTFPDAVRRARRYLAHALIIGHRTDLDVNTEIDFSSEEWEDALRKRASNEGVAMMHAGVDYFVFRRRYFHTVPPLLIGRPAVDGWVLWYARNQSKGLIDVGPELMVVHQNHRKPGEWAALGQSPETQYNLSLVSTWVRSFTPPDATHELRGGTVRRRLVRALIHRVRITTGIVRGAVRSLLGTWLQRAKMIRFDFNS
jgi:hypothetical protein